MRKTCLFLLLLTALARPADSPAEQLLGKVLQAYVDLKSGVIAADVRVLDPQVAGQQKLELKLQRPRKLRFQETIQLSGQPPVEVLLVSDGTDVSLFNSAEPKVYYQGAMPGPIRAIDLPQYFPELRFSLGGLFLRAMTGMPENVLDQRKLSKTSENELRLTDESNESVDVWTLDPATHYVVKVANYHKGELMAEGTITYARVGETLEDSQFSFSPPAGAERKSIEREE